MQLVTVPCIPLGRAASMTGWSTCAIATVVLAITVLYIGSLVSISIYWIKSTTILGVPSSAMLLLLGWVLFAIGPGLAIPVVAMMWWANVVKCGLADDNTDGTCDHSDQKPTWVVLMLGLQLLITMYALTIRAVIKKRYGLQSSSNCCVACCRGCCVPFCMVANTVEKARKVQRQLDELPAHTA